MKKIMIMLSIFLVIATMCTGCDLEVDDSEKRTYYGVVYDRAYLGTKSEGLKCHSEMYYLFNESDNIVLNHIYYTCGKGTITEYKGTWDGNLDNEATLYFTIGGEKIEKKVTFDEYNMYDNDKKEYDKEDVKNVLLGFSRREYLKYE